MAHNLFTDKNGKTSFASAIEPAWHGLGQILDHRMTSSEAIQEAGLDYNVVKREIYTEEAIEVPGFFATFREDTKTPLGVVKGRYEIVQNRDCFNFFDAIVGEGAAIYETAGALGKGERVFITAKLPKHIMVGKDVVEMYLFLSSSHDGSGAIKAAFTPTRVVCANTLAMAMGNGKKMISIRHTKSAQEQLKMAHKLMEITIGMADHVGQVYNRMAEVKITDEQVQKLIELAFQPTWGKAADTKELTAAAKKTVEAVSDYTFNHDTQKTAETTGTLYGFLNGVTGYFQNAKSYGSVEDKVVSIVEGRANQYSTTAYDLAVGVLTGAIKLS